MDSLMVSLSGTLDKLTDFVQQQSPAVWDILIKQVYVNAVANSIGAILGLLGIIVGYTLAQFANKKSNGDDAWQCLLVVAILLIPAGLVFAIACGITAFKEFYNPAYYAIQFLLP